jgi:hypothetical protein
LITDEAAKELTHTDAAVRIAVSSSARNGVVGIGRAIKIQASSQGDPTTETFSSTLGIRTEQDLFSGELIAIAVALSQLQRLRYQNIMILTRSKSAALTIRQPRQQSGQERVYSIYKSFRKLRREGNTTRVVWLPSGEECELLTLAKEKAKIATQQEALHRHSSRLYGPRPLGLHKLNGTKPDASQRTLENTPKELIQHYQASTRDGCHGKRPAY